MRASVSVEISFKMRCARYLDPLRERSCTCRTCPMNMSIIPTDSRPFLCMKMYVLFVVPMRSVLGPSKPTCLRGLHLQNKFACATYLSELHYLNEFFSPPAGLASTWYVIVCNFKGHFMRIPRFTNPLSRSRRSEQGAFRLQFVYGPLPKIPLFTGSNHSRRKCLCTCTLQQLTSQLACSLQNEHTRKIEDVLEIHVSSRIHRAVLLEITL